eukprot:543709_1
MGNKQSSAKNTKNEETKGSSLKDQLLPWQCIKCKKANHEHVLRCISCHSANPELEPNGFIRDILDDKKEDIKKNKRKRKNKNVDSKFKNSLLTIQEIQVKFDKFFPNNINKNLDNENKNDDNDIHVINRQKKDIIQPPIILPVIHIAYYETEEDEIKCLQKIDQNIELVKKFNFNGIWLIDHNYGPETDLVQIIKKVRKKHPTLWIGANFLKMEMNGENLIPFLVKNELIVNHNDEKHKNKENILNGLWVDNGGISETYNKYRNNEDNKEDKYKNKYVYTLAALRILQLKYYDIRNFLYFGGIDFKTGRQIIKTKDIETYKMQIGELAKFSSCGFMDVVCTSGKGTGISADIDKIHSFRESTLNRSLIAIASGVTPENVIHYIGHTDFILVATGISAGFHTLDETKCQELRTAIDEFKYA